MRERDNLCQKGNFDKSDSRKEYQQSINGNLEIEGMLMLDVDGTLTRPNSQYAIEEQSINVLSEFIDRGGICVFNSGATKGRVERTVLNPIFCSLDGRYDNFQTVSKIFQERIILLPENGSAILKLDKVKVLENELYFDWREENNLSVPDKEKLRKLIEGELVPKYGNSFVVGDKPGEIGQRTYILSWKGLVNTPELIEMIKTEIIPEHREINWDKIGMKAARTTIDFIHADSGKKSSTEVLLAGLNFKGSVLGFGDLGDEFAKVVPTFNVNQGKPNEFRQRGMASMELTDWKLLEDNEYKINDKDNVIDLKTDKEMNVLRSRNGKIIYAIENENQLISSILDGDGRPVKIEARVEDAGKGTAWIIRQLIDSGYFDKEN